MTRGALSHGARGELCRGEQSPAVTAGLTHASLLLDGRPRRTRRQDSSKVDRSAAYAARHIAKNLVAAGVCDKALIQVAYAIGVAQPVGLNVNTFGTAKVRDSKGKILHDSEIGQKIFKLFDMRPYAIVKRLGLKNPIFLKTASYGHFGRDYEKANVEVYYEVPGSKPRVINGNGKKAWLKKVELFAWEKLDYVDKIKEVFKI